MKTLKAPFLAALAVLVTVGFAQEGPSSADSISFTTTKVKVTDLVVNYLKGLGEQPVGEIVQIDRKPGKAPNTVEYTFPNYRMVISSQGAILSILENLRMTRNGEESVRTEPRFASAEAVQAEINKIVQQDGGPLLAQDTYQMNGMYQLYFHEVSGKEAAKAEFNGGRPYYEAAFGKRHYGYDMHAKPDYFYLAFDSKSGEFLYYRRRLEQDDLANLNGDPVSSGDAVATAQKAHNGTPTVAEKPEWVFSNTEWGAPAPADTKGHLAFIVSFGKDEVWVDARTGLVIGGVTN